MDNENVAKKVSVGQASPELHPSTKRLLLSCHLNLISKKLHRGLCVEEREILNLLPFTVANGWRPDSATHEDFVSPGDADWTRRVAEASAP